MDAEVGRLGWMHVFVDVPASAATATRAFWSAVLGWPVGEPWAEHPEFVSLVPPEGDPYVHVQEIGGPSRVHVDVVVADLDAARDEVREMGAQTGLRTPWWQVMTSPGGLPFCLCREPGRHRRPAATIWPDGHRTRLLHACLDVPAGGYDVEETFWQRLTGWPLTAGVRRREFARLDCPDDAPLNLLLQRLESDDPETTTRAHLDLGTDDVAAETRRIEALGGRCLDTTHPWSVLQDPAGLPFCVVPRA